MPAAGIKQVNMNHIYKAKMSTGWLTALHYHAAPLMKTLVSFCKKHDFYFQTKVCILKYKLSALILFNRCCHSCKACCEPLTLIKKKKKKHRCMFVKPDLPLWPPEAGTYGWYFTSKLQQLISERREIEQWFGAESAATTKASRARS